MQVGSGLQLLAGSANLGPFNLTDEVKTLFFISVVLALFVTHPLLGPLLLQMSSPSPSGDPHHARLLPPRRTSTRLLVAALLLRGTRDVEGLCGGYHEVMMTDVTRNVNSLLSFSSNLDRVSPASSFFSWCCPGISTSDAANLLVFMSQLVCHFLLFFFFSSSSPSFSPSCSSLASSPSCFYLLISFHRLAAR